LELIEATGEGKEERAEEEREGTLAMMLKMGM
jgi:hypothetical protein